MCRLKTKPIHEMIHACMCEREVESTSTLEKTKTFHTFPHFKHFLIVDPSLGAQTAQAPPSGVPRGRAPSAMTLKYHEGTYRPTSRVFCKEERLRF